jgi:hypothetical protein
VALGAAGDIPRLQKAGAIEWDLQTVTFIVSLCFQLATLVVSAVTLAQSGGSNPAPPLLVIVVALELIVQCIEIVWYGLVGALYYFGQLSIGVRYRYYDWAITTPVSLAGLIIFVWYLECQSATSEILSEGSRIAAIVIIILMDYCMLFIGYAFEAELDLREWLNKAANWVPLRSPTEYAAKYGMIKPGGDPQEEFKYSLYAYRGLFLGWVPFLGIFIPMFIALGTAKPADGAPWGYAVFAVLVTFFTWGLYGVVALVYRSPKQAKMKNAAYNVLDIVSKNIIGLVTSIVALNLSNPSDGAIPWNATVCNATA